MRRTMIVAVLLAAIAAGCGRAAPDVESGGVDDESVAMEFSLLGMNELAATSAAGVVATVEAVSSPRWNSVDGREWSRNEHPGSPGAPQRYRQATITVKEVLFESERLQPTVGAQLTVHLYGDGSDTGAAVDAVNPVARWNAISGPFAAGESKLLLLDVDLFATDSDEREVVRLRNHFQGQWTIERGRATSLDSRRTVDATALRARIEAERAKGRVQDMERDRRTSVDPLA